MVWVGVRVPFTWVSCAVSSSLTHRPNLQLVPYSLCTAGTSLPCGLSQGFPQPRFLADSSHRTAWGSPCLLQACGWLAEGAPAGLDQEMGRPSYHLGRCPTSA